MKLEQSRKLQDEIQTAKTAFRYVLKIPLETSHSNHVAGVPSTLAHKRIQPVVQDRISELVANGNYYILFLSCNNSHGL